MFFFRAPKTPAEIYAYSLNQLYLGHALLYPEPHESGYLRHGDVGFVRDGAFVVMFNVDPASTRRYWKPPFKPEEPFPEIQELLKSDRRKQPLASGEYSSVGIERRSVDASADLTTGSPVSVGFGAHYACNAAFGAVLKLKSETASESIYDNFRLKDYILLNHEKWYAYVRSLKQAIKPKELVFISGLVRSYPDWASAVFSSRGSTSGMSLRGNAGGAGGIGVGTSHAAATVGPTTQRHGETFYDQDSDGNPGSMDQYIFIKRYKVRWSLRVLRKMVAGAGYHNLPESDDDRGGSTGGSPHAASATAGTLEEDELADLATNDVTDPLDVLLEYMFEVSGAEAVIASDDDVANLVNGKTILDFSSYLRHLQPKVSMIDDVVAYLDINELADKYDTLTERNSRSSWPSKSDIMPSPAVQTLQNVRRDRQIAPNGYTYSDDGEHIAASFGAHVLVWQTADGIAVQRMIHTRSVISLALCRRNGDRFLVCGSEDGTMTMWTLEQYNPHWRSKSLGSPVRAIACSPDGSLVATATHGDLRVALWDASTGELVASLARDMKPSALAFFTTTRDELRLHVQCGASACVYDMNDKYPLYHVSPAAADSSDQDWSYNEPVLVQPNGSPRPILLPHRGLLPCVRILLGRYEITAIYSEDAVVHPYGSRGGTLRHSREFATRCTYSPDGKYVARVTIPNTIEIYDAKSKERLSTMSPSRERVYVKYIHFLPDSQKLMVIVGALQGRHRGDSIELLDINKATPVQPIISS